MFHLQFLKPLMVDMVDSLMPEVDVRFDLLSFSKQCGADVICIEDEHPPFLVPLRDDLAFFFDEAPEVGEPDLYPLIDDLSDRHQVLRDRRDV